jgi:hypothetical protein
MTNYLTTKDPDGQLIFDFEHFGEDLVRECLTPPVYAYHSYWYLEIDHADATYRFTREVGKGKERRLLIMIRPRGPDRDLCGVNMPDCTVDTQRPLHAIWSAMFALRRKADEPFAKLLAYRNKHAEREAALAAASEKFRCLTGLDVERDPKHRRANFAVTLSAGAKEIHLSGEVDQTSTVAIGLSPLSIEDFAYLLKMLERTFARVRRAS